MNLAFLKGRGFKVIISAKFVAAVTALVLSISQRPDVGEVWRVFQSALH
jgi:hypothetical protein